MIENREKRSKEQESAILELCEGKIIDQAIFARLSAPSVDIRNKKWEECEMSDLSCSILKWNATQMNLIGNRQKNILKEINHISFPSLREIELADNEIQSIEGISRIRLPLMEKLQIDGNKINQISDFKKVNFPNLALLSISYNQVKDSGNSKPENIGAKNLKKFLIEVYNISYLQFNDLRWLMKMESNLQYLSVRSQKRISVQATQKCIKRRHPNSKVNSIDAYE